MAKDQNIWVRKFLPFDNTQAYDEGWGLFTADSNDLRILKLDDPPASRPFGCRCDKKPLRGVIPCGDCYKAGFRTNCPKRPVFRYDAEALHHVMEKAREGSVYHKVAIAIAAKFVKFTIKI